MATGTINCGLCGDSIALEFSRAESHDGAARLSVSDWAPMREHMETQCRELTPQALEAPKALHNELVGRVYQLLDGGHFMSTAGSGACTMCGTDRADCMSNLQKASRKGMASAREPGKYACCLSCGDGNTHPAPGETWDCQVWAASRGAKS